MNRRRGSGLVLLLVAVALLTGGCRKVLSEPVVESVGSDVMSQISGADVTVDCPASVTMRTDNDFFCTTRVADRTGWLLVHQVDGYGRIEFERVQPLERALIERIVEAHMQRQYGIDTTATCPDRIIQKPDHNFTCTLAGEDPIDVRQVDGVKEYVFNWRGESSTGGRR